MWVQYEVDRSTGATQTVAWAGRPGEGGVPITVSTTAGLVGIAQPLPDQSETAKTLEAFTQFVYSNVGKAFSAEEGVDLVRSLAQKIAGKDPNTKMSQGGNIVSNMLALAPKVRPENSETYAKGVTAMMLASGIFDSPSKQAGFMGSLGSKNQAATPAPAPSAMAANSGQSAQPEVTKEFGDPLGIRTGVFNNAKEKVEGAGNFASNVASKIGEGVNAVRERINPQQQQATEAGATAEGEFGNLDVASAGLSNSPVMEILSQLYGGQSSEEEE